jgi:hypothetical protein
VAIIFALVGGVCVFFVHADTNCTVSAELVNTCRPWVGGVANNYPQVGSNTESQINYQEQRQGRQDDIVHTYHPIGSNTLSSADVYFATRPNTMLYTNWKPTPSWGDIASQNSGIDNMASSIKAIPNQPKIFMTLWHEPENDVSPGGDSNCTNVSYKGSAGTVAQYKAMWAYVENRFTNVDHVTNVVWAMDYMNYPPWNCLVPDLYPGDQYIDWIMFNAYDNSTTTSFDSDVDNLLNIFTTDNNKSINGNTYDYLSKPLGIVESGITGESISAEETFWDQEKTALDDNTFPQLKAYMVYDSLDQGQVGGTNFRVGYDDDGTVDPTRGSHYYAFVDDPRFTDAYYKGSSPALDTTPPTISLSAPAANSTIKGTITVSGNAADNVSVVKVELYVDNQLVTTGTRAPYDFSLDTTKYSNTSHSIYLEAFDGAGNHTNSSTIMIKVNNASTSAGNAGSGGGPSSGGGGASTPSSATTKSSVSAEVPVSGVLSFTPTTPGNGEAVSVDGKAMVGTSVDTTKLTNGVHTVTVIENGKTRSQVIKVHNSAALAVRNYVLAHTVIDIVSLLSMIIVSVFAVRFWGHLKMSSVLRGITRLRHYRL